jgi:hypothetical protein
MNAKDFRIGNYIHYHIEDRMDERKEWDELSQIDYDDLRCLTTYEDNSEYRPIPLTEEWLLKFGFVSERTAFLMGFHNKLFSGLISVEYDKLVQMHIISIGEFKDITRVAFIHELQNVIHALTGEELILKT